MADEDVLDQQTEEEPEDSEKEEGAEPSLQDQLKESIDVRVEEVGPLRKKLTITVPQDKIAERLDDQYGELRRDAAVPGFRKGRAPRRLLEKRFGADIGETLVQQFVSSGYMAAIEKTDLKVIGDPMIWIKEKNAETDTLVDVQRAIDEIELPKDGPLEFACEVEVRPEFELPEIEGIPLEKPVVTISDDDVNVQLERIRQVRGTYETLPEGKVEPDDIVIVDLKMTSEGAALKEEQNVRLAARPQVLDGVTLENLGEVLTGAKVGDVRTASGQLPDDYTKAELRGKPAEFEFRVREIQRLRLPLIDEQFIKSIGFESEKDMRDWVRADMESRLGEQVRRGMAGQVYKYLLDKVSFDLPGRASERQAGRVMIRRMLDLYRQGVPPAEVEKHLDELKTGAQEETNRDLKLFFIMEKLSEKVEVEISEAEINNQIAAIAQRQNRRFDRVRDELAKENGLVNIYMQLRDEKIVDQLIAKANVTEAKPQEQPASEKAETKKPRTRRAPPKSKDKGADDTADET